MFFFKSSRTIENLPRMFLQKRRSTSQNDTKYQWHALHLLIVALCC